MQSQEGLHRSFLEEAYSNQNHMRGAPSDNSQSQHYHQLGESSTSGAAATASGNSGTEEQIASDFEYAKRLQEMEDPDDGMVWPHDDSVYPDVFQRMMLHLIVLFLCWCWLDSSDISCVPSPSDSDSDGDDDHDHNDEEVIAQIVLSPVVRPSIFTKLTILSVYEK